MSGVGVRAQRDVVALVGVSLAGFFMYGCNNILMTLLPAYALHLGATMVEAGLQATVFLLVAVGMRLYFGPLADRRGTRFVMTIGALSFVVSSLALMACTTFWHLLLIRCIQAVGLSAFWPCAVAAVACLAPPGRAGLFIGWYRFATAASLLFGPLVALALVDRYGYETCFALLAGSAGLACILTLCFAPSANKGAGSGQYGGEGKGAGVHGTLRCAFASGQRALVLLLCATALSSLGYGLVMNFVVTFVEGADVPLNAGLFFTCFSVGGLIANPLAGWIVDVSNKRILLAVLLGGLGIGIGLIACVPAMPLILLVAGFVAGVGSSASTIVVLSTITLQVDERFRSSALALQQNVVDLGIACASTLFGWLFAVVAIPGMVFVGQAACLVAGAFVVLAAKKALRF